LTAIAFNGITFDAADRKFSILTSNVEYVGTYTVTITATEINNSVTNSLKKFELSVYNEILEPSSVISDQIF